MSSQNIKVNENGGVYRHGKTFPLEKRVEVGLRYHEMVQRGTKVTARLLAKEARIGRTLANQIIKEMVLKGGVEHPTTTADRQIQRGVGIKKLTTQDEYVLLCVYYDNPKALLRTYQERLRRDTGTVVSPATLSRWFRKRFPHRMSFRKTNKVPMDKFKPENILKIHEYNLTVSRFIHQPWRIKFGDEKPLKGADLFNGRARKDPFTGIVPATVVNSDFRNTYNVIGYCGIDPTAPAVDYYIVGEDQTTTAAVFMDTIYQSIAKGFLHAGDILVLDNASIHRYRESAGLRDLLWTYGVLLLPLPTRCPELNPIELVWNVLVQRLRSAEMEGLLRQPEQYPIVSATERILSSIPHEEIGRFYAHCGYLAK